MSDLKLALSSLIGGGTGALDAIDGAGLNDGDAAVVVLPTGVYHYHLNATSGAAENSPYVIAPDTNPGTKRWILVAPKAPFSHVEASLSGAQSIPDAAFTTLVFDTETQDFLEEYNPSTGIFTATKSGVFFINSCVRLVGATAQFVVSIQKNSTLLYANNFIGTATDMSLFISAGVSLAVSDTINISVFQSSGASKNTSPSSAYTYLTIDRIA